MCFMVCRVFGWILDLFQRIITFAFACSISCAVCCGLTVSIGAGVAYGYNYSLAEFLTFARSDISVYVRRGQFNDKPDLDHNKFRRSGDTDDLFSSNITDYQDEKHAIDSKPLSHTWVKIQDTRKYAEKLTKYTTSEKAFVEESPSFDQSDAATDIPSQTKEVQNPSIFGQVPVRKDPSDVKFFKMATPPPRLISIEPNTLLLSTTIFPNGKSEIIMRNFGPLKEKNPAEISIKSQEDEVYEDYGRIREKARDKEHKENSTPDIKIRVDDSPKSNYIPMRHWSKIKPLAPLEYLADDEDDDNLVYKPV